MRRSGHCWGSISPTCCLAVLLYLDHLWEMPDYPGMGWGAVCYASGCIYGPLGNQVQSRAVPDVRAGSKV